MKQFLLIFIFVLVSFNLYAQDIYFTYGKNSTIELTPNLLLVNRLIKYIDVLSYDITAYNGLDIIFIPTEIELKKGSTYIITNSFIAEYEYLDAFDAVQYPDVIVNGYEFDFSKEKDVYKYEKNIKLSHDKDPHKPKDLDKKIKDKIKKDKTEGIK